MKDIDAMPVLNLPKTIPMGRKFIVLTGGNSINGVSPGAEIVDEMGLHLWVQKNVPHYQPAPEPRNIPAECEFAVYSLHSRLIPDIQQVAYKVEFPYSTPVLVEPEE